MTGKIEGRAKLPPLREADWRFLLPGCEGYEFGHLILSGGPRHLAERLVSSGVAGSVGSRQEGGSTPDAVALLPGSSIDPVEALSWLTPGKHLYVEVDRSLGRGRRWIQSRPRRLIHRLESAGASIVGVYLIVGDPEGPMRSVQIDAPEALSWYIEHMISGSTRGQAALQRLAGRFPGVVANLAWQLAPRFAVVAMRSPACPNVIDPAEVVIMLTSGVDDGSRVVTLGIPAGAREPRLVRKASRLAFFNEQIQAEHRALIALRQRLQPVTRRAVPCSLGVERHGALVSGVETAAPGTSVLDLAWRRSRPARDKVDDLRLATSWLIDAHRQLQSAAPVGASAWLAEALTLSGDDSSTHSTRLARVRRVVERARADLARIAGLEMPLTVRHRDFGPWNVLRHGQELMVIDWENCRPEDPAAAGPGLCDLLHLAMHWSFAARGLHSIAEQVAGLLDLTGESQMNTYAVAARREIRRYMRELDVDARLLDPLLVLTLLEHAVERERREAFMNPAGEPGPENRFFTLLERLETPAGHRPHG